MIYLIDGYNVTRRDPATSNLDIEQQRDALVARLRVRQNVLLGPGRCIVVFDGPQGSTSHSSSGMLPQVVFASSADDEIVRIASRASEKVVLVSDDRDLGHRVSTHAKHGAEIRPASSCFDLAAGDRTPPRRRRPPVARDGGLPPGADDITKEMMDIWLDDNE